LSLSELGHCGGDGGDGRNAGPPLAGAGALGAVVEAEFIDVDGIVRRGPLGRCWSVALERFRRCGVPVVSGAAESAEPVVVRRHGRACGP
jgi:hypothetical protein